MVAQRKSFTVKQITPKLEAKIREQIEFVEDRMQQYMHQRMEIERETGEFPKVGDNEAEAAAWRRALKWVLSEGDK